MGFPWWALYFLKRHPMIEYLSIENARGHVLDDQDLPLLKTLHLGGLIQSSTPASLAPTARCQLTHLRFREILDLASVHDLIKNVSSTLQYLEIGWWIHYFRNSIPRFGRLLQLVPRLEELRVNAMSEVNANSDIAFRTLEPLRGDDLVGAPQLHFDSFSDLLSHSQLSYHSYTVPLTLLDYD